MELALTEEQAAVRDAFRQLFERFSTPEHVRAAEPATFDPALWERVVAMGGPVLAIPEALGGGGGTLLDLSIVCDEQGRRLGSVPLVESAVTARLLERVGAFDARHRVGRGNRIVDARAPTGIGGRGRARPGRADRGPCARHRR